MERRRGEGGRGSRGREEAEEGEELQEAASRPAPACSDLPDRWPHGFGLRCGGTGPRGPEPAAVPAAGGAAQGERAPGRAGPFGAGRAARGERSGWPRGPRSPCSPRARAFTFPPPSRLAGLGRETPPGGGGAAGLSGRPGPGGGRTASGRRGEASLELGGGRRGQPFERFLASSRRAGLRGPPRRSVSAPRAGGAHDPSAARLRVAL